MTRKIKSLKENECILISTKREARIIKRKTGSLHSAKEMKGIYYYKHKGINCISVNPLDIVLPASDFIKPRLKDKGKAISKQLDIITIAGKPVPCTLIKGSASDIEVKDPHHVKEYSASEPYNRAPVAQAKSEETVLSELPEKWCLKVDTDEKTEIFLPWLERNKQTSQSTNYKSHLPANFGEYFVFPKIRGGHLDEYKIPVGYIEITFDQFRKWVLKDAEEVKPGLEVGKWYKGDVDKNIAVYFITEITGDDFSAYGINYKGIWVDNKPHFGLINCENIRLATEKEVSAALIKEAKRRYIGDIRILTPSKERREYDLKGLYAYEFIENSLWAKFVGYSTLLFQDGQWAEIVEQPKEIDWSVPGQLVTNEDESIVWLLLEENEYDSFIGSVMYHSDKCVYDDNRWLRRSVSKDGLKPYTGEPIILTNAKN